MYMLRRFFHYLSELLSDFEDLFVPKQRIPVRVRVERNSHYSRRR